MFSITRNFTKEYLNKKSRVLPINSEKLKPLHQVNFILYQKLKQVSSNHNYVNYYFLVRKLTNFYF